MQIEIGLLPHQHKLLSDNESRTISCVAGLGSGKTTGAIYKIDPNDLTNTVASFALDFGAVGMTIVGSDIWTTDWSNKSVGIWDEGTETYTHKFFTEGNSGALAYDADDGVLWVGQAGGWVQAFDPITGNIPNGATNLELVM